MVRATLVVLYFVITIAITVWMTILYVKNYRTVKIGYPIAVLVLFTVLIILYSFPMPKLFGEKASEIWLQITNGGYLVDESYSFLTPIGLGLLTLKLYCTSNVVVGLFYLIMEKLLHHAEKLNELNRKQKAVELRKENASYCLDLPEINQDFCFITDIMPVNGIIEYKGQKIEIINNSGKKIPEGHKKIYARRIKDFKQIDSKTDAKQPEDIIPYIEIWDFEAII